MNHDFFLNTDWHKATRSIAQGDSVLLHVPKNYGRNNYIKAVRELPEIIKAFSFINLNVPDDDDCAIDYQQTLQDIISQLKFTGNLTAHNKIEFIERLESLIAERKILIVVKVNVRNSRNHVKLLYVFEEFFEKCPSTLINKLSLLIIDDYSLNAYERTIGSEISLWNFLVRVFIGQFRYKRILEDNLKRYNSRDPNADANTILRLTGGHEGLIVHFFDHLKNSHVNPSDIDLATEIKLSLSSSQVLSSMSQILNNKSVEYLTTVLEFQNKKLNGSSNPALFEELLRLGIVLRVDNLYSILPNGVVLDLINDIYHNKQNGGMQPINSKKLILFVHGLGGAYTTWERFLELIKDDPEISSKYSTAVYVFPTSITGWRLNIFKRMPRIQELAEGLKAEIENLYQEYDEIILVCHSLGGLVGRQYLLNEVSLATAKIQKPKLKVKKIIMYATPHNGSDLANIGKLLTIKNHQVKQLCRRSEFIVQLNNDWVNFKIGEQVKTKYIIGGIDTIVEPSSAQGFWGNENTVMVIGANHFTIIKPLDQNHISYKILRNCL